MRHRPARRLGIRAALVGACLLAWPLPAAADLTGWAGVIMPSPRPTLGIAWGRASRLFGFEVEVARTFGDSTEVKPSLTTASASLLAQSPPLAHGVQVYGVGGFGIYGESRGEGRGATDTSRHIGGGAKIPLAGQLKLRLDYRFFTFSRSPDAAPVDSHLHRLSAGLTVAF